MAGLPAMLRRAATRRLRRSIVGGCAVFFVANLLGRMRLVRGDLGCDSGAAHADRDIEDSLRYIQMVHREYLEQAGIDRFHGQVAEVGPGDSSGVGLLMLADGAQQVDLVDRFYSRRDLDYHKAVYARLREAAPALQSLAPLDFDGENCAGLARRYGPNATAEAFFVERSGYDFIVSRAVMEHVLDPVTSIERMAAALKPGGWMLHVVDLRDHGMFTDYGFPELTFLRIPPWFYRHMSEAIARPNRVPLSRYRRTLPSAEFKVTGLVGVGRLDRPTRYEAIPEEMRRRSLDAVRRQRKRLHPAFQGESDEDLSVSGFFLVFRKPEA